MKATTNLEAGARISGQSAGDPARANRSQTLVRDGVRRRIAVTTGIRAGQTTGIDGKRPNHNQTLVRDAVQRRVTVATGIRAGTPVRLKW